MSEPRLLLLAGPNGSGKSTYFRRYLEEEVPDFINADVIAAQLGVAITNEVSWQAKLAADRARHNKLDEGASFCTETVLSHVSWLAFLRKAKERDYFVSLIFICLASHRLNLARVRHRVEHGGHDVPEDRIAGRYERSLEYCRQAISIVDETTLIDNSSPESPYRIVARFLDSKPVYLAEAVPDWAQRIVNPPTSP